jgi:hypothetical protein
MGIHPVYIVGSKRHGLEAITEQFDRLYSPTDKVSLHFIHGYNGTEVGEESAYPVDVSVNGRCVATGIRFKSTSIIRVLPAGTFEITVYRSDGRCAKSAIQTIPLVVSADGINIEPTRTVILSHQESSRPKLSVVHNQAKYPQVSVRNFIDKPLELTLTATNPDGTTYLARAWVYPDTCAALGVDEDHLKQYSLTAADSLGASFPLHFQTQTRRTNVVYVVGSTKSGYVAIRDIFERNQPKYLTASVSQ